MTEALLWMAAGIVVSGLAGVIVAMIVEPEFRQAVGQVALAMLGAPVLLFAMWVRTRAPRTVRLSPGALERFARMRSSDATAGFLFGYRGRGVILVRKAGRRESWLNDVPNTAHRVAGDARRFGAPSAQVRDDGPGGVS